MCLLAVDGLLELVLLLWMVVQGVLAPGILVGLNLFGLNESF